MNELQFDFEWENPMGAAAPELAATWAHLVIRVNETLVTQVHEAPLQELRGRLVKIDPLRAPWAEGYALARQLRKDFQLEGRTARTVEDVGTFFGLSPRDLKSAVVSWRDDDQALAFAPGRSVRFYDALVGTNELGSPGFLLHKQHESSRMFAFCRALFEYLTASTGPAALISSALSERQKRNRAFAAEFLAPAEMLQETVSGSLSG